MPDHVDDRRLGFRVDSDDRPSSWTDIVDRPGWTVEVDGSPGDLRGDVVLGVGVPSGMSEVEFRYRPPGLVAGVVVIALTVLAWVLVALVMATRRCRTIERRLVASRPVTEPTAPSEDAAAYIARVRADEADAERRRRQEPEIQRRGREIERAWIDVAPPGAAGEQGELLLDRADRLSMIDVDALGVKPGARQVKGTIRKAVYWYLRYVTDQVNALTNVLVRLVRRMDERLGASRLLSAPVRSTR